MRMPSTYSASGALPIAVAGAVVVFAYVAGRQISAGQEFNAFLLAVVAFGVLVVLNPRLGLYAFCFTLILVPFNWRIDGLKITSPNAILVGMAVVSWAATLVFRYDRLKVSSLYAPLAIVVLVTWFNYVRYGSPFFNTPYILSESVVLFLLGFHLFRSRVHLSQMLMVVAAALAVRNAIDLGLTIASINNGSVLGAIRADQLLQATASTTESEWRSLLLPLLLAGTLLIRSPRLRMVMGVALVTNIAWLALAVTRTAMIGLAAAPLVLMFILPRSKRSTLLAMVAIGVIIVVFLAGFYSDSWFLTVGSTRDDLGAGWEAGRFFLWRDAFQGFLRNPWWGSGLGPSHSFILGTGRKMGLVFLVPFLAALWLVWRHGAWLRRQQLDGASQTFVVGVQAAVLVAVPLALLGTLFQAGVNAFLFWLLVGVQEAIYHDVRSGRHAIVRCPSPPGDDRGLEPPESGRASVPRLKLLR